MPTEWYCEMWWEDMSEKAHQAAKKLGYNQETWDDDASIPYDHKEFLETSLEERCAAMYLGLNPINAKLDVWWDDMDKETQKHLNEIDWNQEKWDDDWDLPDLAIDEKAWEELNDNERNAVAYFGYTKCIWDETDDDEDLDFNAPVKINSKPSSHGAKPHKDNDHRFDEKKEDDIHNSGSKPSSVAATTSAGHKIQAITKSKRFGGDGGDMFNDGNHRVITKITIRADEHAIHHITVAYMGGKVVSHGKEDGGSIQSISLSETEYITEVKVRHNKLIQSLTLFTNTGNKLGPIGGKGWPKIQLRKDHEGEEETIKAPSGQKLCGFSGSAGHYIDSIVFHWIPIE